MGVFDEAIKQEQDRSDAKEMDRIHKLEEKEARQRALEQTAETLVPYVRTALAEFPEACRKLGCDYLTIFVKRKPTFFNRKEYEKWNGLPVYKTPYSEYLIFIHDGKYYAKPENTWKWDCRTGTNELYIAGRQDALLCIYTDQLPAPVETSMDKAVRIIADNMAVRFKKDAENEPGSVSGFKVSELTEMLNDAYEAYKKQDYEKAVTLYFMHSFKQMQARKNTRFDKMIREY